MSCGALLWAFNLRKKIDPITGMEVEVPLFKSNSLLIIKPDPFQMAFEPRSPQREHDIRRNWLEANEIDEQERADFVRLAAEKRKEVRR